MVWEEKIKEISLKDLKSPFFVHQKRYRKITGYEYEGMKFYLKEYFDNFDEVKREWENLKFLYEKGFPVPKPLFIKEEKEKIVIGMEALRGTPLSEILKKSDSEDKYLKALSLLLGKLHKENLFHQDCYLNHFYWDEETKRLSFLDVARIKNTKVFSFYYQVKDLAQLGYSFEEYLGEKGPHYFQNFLKFYEELTGRLSPLQKILLKFKISRIRFRTLKRKNEGKPL
ncbi:hypothetical protein THC_1558 [Caldimicrobium thiodismutans]|uniref:Uncharacterized protein n=1 Tax=Caldimicrobium thiodismutans TaxID=1653476 RepID=A0A0U5AJ41_9BACT|nr:lipopolysaccharide kinase InaA family protein [Caldimicrobium thiodismutans]BAU23923.1 hypothetical protein THC_1558 [Caldimicrobium thiodismutans]